MAGIDAANTSLEEIEALGKRWVRQATTGEEFRYSFEELVRPLLSQSLQY